MALERDEIERALRAADGKMNRAARLLGLSRRQLQNRMRAVGLGPRKAGRPKRALKYAKRHAGWAVGAAAIAAVAAGAVALGRRSST